MAVVVFRGLLGEDEDHSVIGNDPWFRQVGKTSKTLRFELPPDEHFESALLGHSNLILDQGPLTVAALGWNPPEGSVHFHVSLLSWNENSVLGQIPPPTEAEFRIIEEQIARLNSRKLTVLTGEGLDHAMVFEKRIELSTVPPSGICKLGFIASRPDGDGEAEIHRFIDDSLNILAEQEFNVRRMDLGVPPINLCWPWGQGERQSVPNRALALRYPIKVLARSLALRGLAKLSGFRPERLSNSLQLDKDLVLDTIRNEPRSLVVLDCGLQPVNEDDFECFKEYAAEIGSKIVEPLLDWRLENQKSLTFVVTNSSNEGLVALGVKENERDMFPFDERSLLEKKVEPINLARLLDYCL